MDFSTSVFICVNTKDVRQEPALKWRLTDVPAQVYSPVRSGLVFYGSEAWNLIQLCNSVCHITINTRTSD
ncbi:hypothetical protein GOODEAATRI_017652, partial [Goodea atripinnis]